MVNMSATNRVITHPSLGMKIWPLVNGFRSYTKHRSKLVGLGKN